MTPAASVGSLAGHILMFHQTRSMRKAIRLRSSCVPLDIASRELVHALPPGPATLSWRCIWLRPNLLLRQLLTWENTPRGTIRGPRPAEDSIQPSKRSKKQDELEENRAGDGNRTRMTSLEGWGSAIELRPRVRRDLAGGTCTVARRRNRGRFADHLG